MISEKKWFSLPDDVHFLADGVVYPDFDPDSLLVLCASSFSSIVKSTILAIFALRVSSKS